MSYCSICQRDAFLRLPCAHSFCKSCVELLPSIKSKSRMRGVDSQFSSFDRDSPTRSGSPISEHEFKQPQTPKNLWSQKTASESTLNFSSQNLPMCPICQPYKPGATSGRLDQVYRESNLTSEIISPLKTNRFSIRLNPTERSIPCSMSRQRLPLHKKPNSSSFTATTTSPSTRVKSMKSVSNAGILSVKQLPKKHELLCEKISRELERNKKRTKAQKELNYEQLKLSSFQDFLEELNTLMLPIIRGQGDANAHFCHMHSQPFCYFAGERFLCKKCLRLLRGSNILGNQKIMTIPQVREQCEALLEKEKQKLKEISLQNFRDSIESSQGFLRRWHNKTKDYVGEQFRILQRLLLEQKKKVAEEIDSAFHTHSQQLRQHAAQLKNISQFVNKVLTPGSMEPNSVQNQHSLRILVKNFSERLLLYRKNLKSEVDDIVMAKYSLSCYEHTARAITCLDLKGLVNPRDKKSNVRASIDREARLSIETHPLSPDPQNFYAQRVMKSSKRSNQTGSTFSKTPKLLDESHRRATTPQAWEDKTIHLEVPLQDTGKSRTTSQHGRVPSNDRLAALLFPTSSVSSRKNSTHKESSSGFDSIMSAHSRPLLVANSLNSEQIEKIANLHCYDSSSSRDEKNSLRMLEPQFQSKVKGVTTNHFKLNQGSFKARFL